MTSTNQLPLVQLDQGETRYVDLREFTALLDAYRKAVINNALYPDAFHVSREREQKALDAVKHYHTVHAHV